MSDVTTGGAPEGNGAGADGPGSSHEPVRTLTGVPPGRPFDHERIARGVREIFAGLGLDDDDPRLAETPERVARMYDEIFAGLLVEPAEVLDVVFEEGHDELVLIKDIPFASTCEHHLVPFVGRAHVGYIPNERGQVTGLSKLGRLVDLVAKRPSLQERITTTVADTLDRVLEPRGVLVIVEAEHLCMSMRGIRKPGAMTVTSAVRGIIREDAATRAEAMSLALGSNNRSMH
ncbi:GTP cyclohydrolase I FolE [Egibacter rhizosphaerae]|uniref:GTP cyclohydrolase 1 n=1 Tax=Egibacter rhizosphaerae TaxID=1670831 RepID=A0A411YDQ4_9ACTN|nr:GTP cyclohydrolase I FolE [Egibacter rhizosphaerae]QBI19277.1 GTP cyclohydrolase I FolE [Egibacter rhizosphaerae]